ncbi:MULTISPECIES: hypothetical protein [Clostridium]|jgi:hypothetical protein|uniref:Lipoprotein n=1 Tax=Clostridium saccharoperbutylacetonicum N1-4(HMT) TaxID=931276 RepID=M1MXS1_9CLOT|nr:MULTISPECIES: hypothetical protein [Clostridium]AGF56217.1 hypothetical protein Cspa_c24520 [Clostridium saccharoperbutylacetonicum N1-4(HMT)]AQR94953.1 hypothetical protein CLSAP_22670 [Clostridium saccharoperbutylacetonicum]NRT63041.1 hypothetical protein [Clostridium saccharoperbutylacetonicum]NSB26398.1 hypothetical protein [Clostridium saccharoperbutylacetonicum]NSB30796.1 hypothetical protein [Clostridium saccharoperbutylacetonicum]
MFKNIKNKIAVILIGAIVSVTFAGCAGSKPGDRLKEIKPIPISVEGVEFKVGESKVGDIVNGGLSVSPDLNFKSGIDGLKLDKMTYYLGYINKDGYNLGNINFVNNTKESKEYKDCLISEYKMKFTNLTSESKKYRFDNILVDGINFKGMSIDDVKKVMAEKTSEVSDIKEPDGSIAILNYTVNKVSVNISFDHTTKTVSEIDVQVYNTFFE